MRSTLGLFAFAALALTAVPATAQRSAQDWLDNCRRQRDRDYDREVFCEVREAKMPVNARMLSVDGRQNGGVAVRGWDGNNIVVSERIQVQAESERIARDVARDIRVTAEGMSVRADGPPMERRVSWSVSYEIYVPRSLDLTLETHNGPILVEDVRGRMDLSAQNGPLALRSVGGDVRGHTTNGPITVSLSGSRWDGEGLDVETTNGPVTLTIPDRYSARLETGTTNGPMRFDFPVTVQGRFSREIRTTLGSGGALVRAVTTNGPVVVRRD